MISLRDQEFIKQRFAEDLVDTVRIDFFTQRETAGLVVPGRQECEFCKPTADMLSELAALTSKIDLRTHYIEDRPAEATKYDIERIPAVVIRSKGGRWFTFYGIPGGNEFPNFIEAIVSASTGGSADELDAEVKRELKRLKEDVHVQVFVTPTCPHCPGMARSAYLLALNSPKVRTSVVEVTEFEDMSQKYQVRAVPTTVISDRVMFPGAVPQNVLMDVITRTVEGTITVDTSVSGAATPAQPPSQPGERRTPGGLILP